MKWSSAIGSVQYAEAAPITSDYDHSNIRMRKETFGGMDEVRKVEVPNNYCLEVEQFGRCVRKEEEPYVTEEFSIALAGTVDRILKQIGY